MILLNKISILLIEIHLTKFFKIAFPINLTYWVSWHNPISDTLIESKKSPADLGLKVTSIINESLGKIVIGLLANTTLKGFLVM